MAKCGLCLKENKLVRSHIIPEFLHSEVYDQASGKALYVTSEGEFRMPTVGERQKLLCADCDSGIIGGYEAYAAPIVNEVRGKDKKGEGFSIEVDYAQFKLFAMSLLWRAGITTHPMFYNVILGKHAELLRRMLLNGDAAEPYKYGFFLIANLGNHFLDMVMSPMKYKSDGHTVHVIFAGGIEWYFVVSSHTKDYFASKYFLHEDGKLYVHASSEKFQAERVTAYSQMMRQLPAPDLEDILNELNQ